MGLESESTTEKTEFSKVKLWFTRNAKLLVVCFAVGMICHAQMYLNGLSNPDAVVSLSNPNGYGSFIPHAWDISLGRWGLLFAACAKFGLCSPILTSAITITLFTLGVFCVAVLLVMVRSLMGGGSESLASLACDARGEAQNPYREEGCSADSLSAKQLAVFFGAAIAVCAAGAVLYYALTEISLFVLGIGLSAYGGASSVGAGSILGSLTSSVPSAYVAFSDALFSHGIFGNHFAWVYVAAACMIVAAVAFVRLAAVNGVKRLGASAMALLCVVLIPFAANVILIIVPGYGYPTPLMLGGFMASFLLLPLLVQLLLDSPDRGNVRLRMPAKAMSVGCCCLIAVGAWSYALQSNADAEVMQACQNQTASLATRIAGVLDANPDVQAGAKVLIAGKPEAGSFPNTSDSYVHASSYAKWGMVWDNHYQNNMRSWDVIMKQFAGQSFNYCSFDECSKVIRSSEFANMSLYPANDSVATIDGVVVVKISDISKYSE